MAGSLKHWLVVGLFLGTAVYALAEDITLTTYYPSPRGVYQELKTAGDLVVGDITNPPGARLHVIQDNPASAVPVFRADDESSETSPFLIDANGNVGIGTNTPQTTLDVNGGIRLGDQTTCDAATEGSVRYNFGTRQLEVCDGTAFIPNVPPSVVTGSFVATGAPSTLIVTNCQPTYVYMNRGRPTPLAPYPGWERWDWGNADPVSIRDASGGAGDMYEVNDIMTFEPNGFTVGNAHPAAGETWWYWAICE